MNELPGKIYESPWTELTVRWLLGATFVFASFPKILSPENFAKAIYSYSLFPEFAINLIAIVLPFIELFSGLALIVGIYYHAAAIIISGMLSAFIIALSINLIRGHQFDCGCFSFDSTNAAYSSELLLIRDIIFLVLSAYILIFKGDRRGCVQKAA